MTRGKMKFMYIYKQRISRILQSFSQKVAEGKILIILHRKEKGVKFNYESDFCTVKNLIVLF